MTMPTFEPVARQATRNGFICKENKNPEYNIGLFTESQLRQAYEAGLRGAVTPTILSASARHFRQIETTVAEQAAQICSETLASIEGELCAEAIRNLKEIPNETQTVPASLD